MVLRRLLSFLSLLFLFAELLDPSTPFVRVSVASSKQFVDHDSVMHMAVAPMIGRQVIRSARNLQPSLHEAASFLVIFLDSFLTPDECLPALDVPRQISRVNKIFPDDDLLA